MKAEGGRQKAVRRLWPVFLLALMALPAAGQQNQAREGGQFVASAYGQWQANVHTTVAAGSSIVIPVTQAVVSLPDGTSFIPWSTSAPITIGIGATAETVTPSAVGSGCAFNANPGACTVTIGTLANAHGANEPIRSGSGGVIDAAIQANAAGGGTVVVARPFSGSDANVTTARSLFQGVGVTDTRSGVVHSSQLLQGTCTGTATASQTLFLYPLGQVTGTTCTITASVAQFNAPRAGTIRNLVCTAGTGGVNGSSGVVSAEKNGSAFSPAISATFGTGTAAADTDAASVVAGDLVRVKFTTQAAETLANVNCSLQFN